MALALALLDERRPDVADGARELVRAMDANVSLKSFTCR